MNSRQRIHAIFKTLQMSNPKPQTELQYRNGFELLIAVILSAQATDISVNKVTKHLFSIAPTPHALAHLPIKAIESCINSIGLYRNKAKNIQACSARLVALHHGQVPKDRQSLQALPGVGRKTANVVLNTLFGLPYIAVDTHIARLSQRLGFSQSVTPDAIEKDLMRAIPKIFHLDAHHWLILHGRYVCKARNPQCQECSIATYCPSKRLD